MEPVIISIVIIQTGNARRRHGRIFQKHGVGLLFTHRYARSLLYINDPKVAEKLDKSNWIKQVDNNVRFKRSNGEWRREYMQFESMMQDKYHEGLKEGETKGEAKGEAKGRAKERSLLCQIFKLSRKGLSYADISKEVDMPEDEIKSILG